MRYTAKKLATMLLTLVIVSFLTFVAFSLLSGDAATRLLGTEATPERLEALRIELGLNDPLLVRYAGCGMRCAATSAPHTATGRA